MERYGITQGQLARKAGYHSAHVGRWLRGTVSPTLETMLVLDGALELLIERLEPAG